MERGTLPNGSVCSHCTACPSEGGGNSQSQEEEEGESPEQQRALPAHGMQGGGGANPEIGTGGPPEQRALPARGMQERDGGGGGDEDTEEGTLLKSFYS